MPVVEANERRRDAAKAGCSYEDVRVTGYDSSPAGKSLPDGDARFEQLKRP